MANVLTENETQLRRLQWRCRRGMLEMDLLLEKFIPLHFHELNTAEQTAFDTLLNYPDNELWATIVNAEKSNSVIANTTSTIKMTSEMQYVLSLLQNCCTNSMN